MIIHQNSACKIKKINNSKIESLHNKLKDSELQLTNFQNILFDKYKEIKAELNNLQNLNDNTNENNTEEANYISKEVINNILQTVPSHLLHNKLLELIYPNKENNN